MLLSLAFQELTLPTPSLPGIARVIAIAFHFSVAGGGMLKGLRNSGVPAVWGIKGTL